MLEHERAYLPIIQNPLVEPTDEDDPDISSPPKLQRSDSNSDVENGHHHHQQSTTSGPRPVGSFPPRRQLTTSNASSESLSFRRFTKATDIELFYDLFFVANLTVFTYVHEVNDGDSLKQYVGFFAILWFTWYQVSLYDVRFYMDSVFERFRKAVQFLVMIGFAICGPEFNPGDEEGGSLEYFQALTLILMVSRLVLVLEYSTVVWFARHNKRKIMLPIILLVITYLVAAMIYLGLYWTFDGPNNHTYIVWYVVAVLETLIATSVSMGWRNLSFVGTHLVERMSLLTLIIFGEGAIAIAKACQYVVESHGALELVGSVPAEIVCAVLNLFFLYMIYFDWIHEELFGTIRQQIWAFLHFPLHVALVLVAEGQSQAITWNAGVRRANELVNQTETWTSILFPDNSSANSPTHPEVWKTAAHDLNSTATYLLSRQLDVASSSLSSLQGLGYFLQSNNSAIPTIASGSTDPTSAGNALWWLTGVLYNTVFKIAGFYSPETASEIATAVDYVQHPIDFSIHKDYEAEAFSNIDKSYTVFKLTYIYFTISVGLFVLLTCVLATLNRGSKSVVFWARLLVTGAMGLGLGLLSVMGATDGVLKRYVERAWLLPTVTISLFGVVCLMGIKMPGKRGEKGRGRREGEKGSEGREPRRGWGQRGSQRE